MDCPGIMRLGRLYRARNAFTRMKKEVMSTVIVKKSSYDYQILKENLFVILDSLGGKGIQRGSHVVIKPNLLAPATPEMAICTHPLVVKIVAEYALDRGAQVQISDSQAIGSFDRILKLSGIGEALEGLNCDIKPFTKSANVDIGEPFGTIEIAEEAMKADVLINLAKLKTHSQMLLTLGVKNIFGCIVGFRKPEWHMRAGIDRETFAKLLVQIYRAVNPSITIVDGILAMDGAGPGKRGKPRYVGHIIAGTDAVAVDATICRALEMASDSLLTNSVARGMGLFPDSIEVMGEVPHIRNFKLPKITPLIYGPRYLQGIVRKFLIQRPIADGARCTLCGKCLQYCPAGAIDIMRGKLKFDYNSCIRCYCCIEVCPQGALDTSETLIGKLIRRYIHRTQ